MSQQFLTDKNAQTFPGILAHMLYGRTVEKSFQFTYTGKAAPGMVCPLLKNSGLYSWGSMREDFTSKYTKTTRSYSRFPLGIREEMMSLKYKPRNGFKLQQKRFQLNIKGTLSKTEGKYREKAV